MPEEKLDLSTAFHRYTAISPNLELAEGDKEVLSKGIAADFILLDKTPDEIFGRRFARGFRPGNVA